MANHLSQALVDCISDTIDLVANDLAVHLRWVIVMESPQVIAVPANVFLLINADSTIVPLVEVTIWTGQLAIDLDTDQASTS
jgi:hypothetical protein